MSRLVQWAGRRMSADLHNWLYWHWSWYAKRWGVGV